jgi:two-component system, chemotaxis family, sensor kinase CheA
MIGRKIMDRKKYFELFLSETQEILIRVNELVVKLEKAPKDDEILNEIFRQIHTLKGMVKTMDYNNIGKITHELESILDLVRAGKLVCNKNIIDLIFEVCDFLELFISELEKDSEQAKKVNDLKILNKLIDLKISFDKPCTENISKQEVNTVDIQALNLVDSSKVFKVSFSIGKKTELKGARSLVAINGLSEIGTVLNKGLLNEKLQCENFNGLVEFDFVTQESKEQIIDRLKRFKELEKILVVANEKLDENSDDKVIMHKNTNIQMVKVSMNKLDDLVNSIGELVINKIRLNKLVQTVEQKSLNEAIMQLGRLTDVLQDNIMDLRLIPIDYIFNRFPRMIRDLAKEDKKEVNLIIEGTEIGLDRTMLEEIKEPLIHILRNAVNHGIESPEERKKQGKPIAGTIIINAKRERNNVVIEVSDDGRGIDSKAILKSAVGKGLVSKEEAANLTEEEAMFLITKPGFSTCEKVTETSGRGVGMDSVKTQVEANNGLLKIETRLGVGSKFILKLPLTMAIIQALLVNVAQAKYAIPLVNIIETIKISSDQIKSVENQEVITYRDSVLPLIRLKDRLKIDCLDQSYLDDSEHSERDSIVIVESNGKQCGLIVDKLLGQQEIVIKSLERPIKGLKGIAGATILGDGKVALIVDIASVLLNRVEENEIKIK